MTSSNASFYMNPQQQPQQLISGGAAPSGGSAPASHYQADAADPLDLMLAAGLATLDRASASKLMLRRLGGGRYEIDGRRVTLRWGDCGGAPGLVACEDEVKDQDPMPLTAYLSQAANVAASLCGQRADMPKIARIPKEQRLTFADKGAKDSIGTAALKLDDVGNERCESMRIACEQAMLREQAAEAYERSLHNPFMRSQPSRGLAPPKGLPVPYLN